MVRKLFNIVISIVVFNFIFNTQTHLLAQAPGYMGKKLSLYYEPAVSPSLKSRFTGYDYSVESEYGRFILNLQHTFSIDYTLTKSIVAGVSFKTMKSQMPGVIYRSEIPENPEGYLFECFGGDVSLHANFISFYIKSFKHISAGSIAPVGDFNKFELMIGRVNGATEKSATLQSMPWQLLEEEYYNELDGDYYLMNTFTNELEDLNFDLTTPVITLLYSWGKQNLFFNRLFFNSVFQVGWVIGPTKSYFEAVEGGLAGGSDEDAYTRDVKVRMQGALLFNLSLGTGFLVF